MARRTPDREALPGTIDAQTLRDLQFVRDCVRRRDQSLGALFGGRRPRSALRDEIIRTAAILFGKGRTEPISYYIKACAVAGSRSSIQREVHSLGEIGLLFLRPHSDDHRYIVVVPSARLIEWAVRSLAELKVAILLRADEEGFVVKPKSETNR
jgi:hypothetical protein